MDRDISLTMVDKTGKQFPFTSYEQFVLFLRTEESFWEQARDSQEGEHSPYISFVSNVSSTLGVLDEWQKSAADKDDATFQKEFTQHTQNLVNQARKNWVWSAHDYVTAFLRCHEHYGRDAAHTFLDYVASKSPTNLGTIPAIQGTLAAYEYEREIGATGNWADGQRASFDTLREQMLADRASLVKDIEELKKSLGEWQKHVHRDWSNNVSRSRKVLAGQIRRRRSQLDALAATRSERFDQLEHTYQEQLRLKKPAEYWGGIASKYRREGRRSAALLTVLLLAGVAIFTFFYTKWLVGQNIGVSLSTLHGVVIISAGVALFAFLVRQASKLMLSSYHLMADAQEREQLAYFYLSLINEGAIDDESRSIVLQALFSRTESGLLAAESGPTMPGIAADALRVASRQRSF